MTLHVSRFDDKRTLITGIGEVIANEVIANEVYKQLKNMNLTTSQPTANGNGVIVNSPVVPNNVFEIIVYHENPQIIVKSLDESGFSSTLI